MTTGRLDLIAEYIDGTEGVWNPMTPVMNAADVREVKMRPWVAGVQGVQVAPGVQFSTDGTTWDAPYELGDFITVTDGWNDPPTWDFTNLYDLVGSGLTPRLQVRFGFFARATGSGQIRPFQGELMLESRPLSARSTATPWCLVYATSATERKFFVTQPIAVTEDIYEARASLELASKAGDGLSARVLWAEANDPMVPADWDYEEAEPVMDWETDTTYGTEFVPVTPSKKFVRFVVGAKLASDGQGFARARVLIDYRD